MCQAGYIVLYCAITFIMHVRAYTERAFHNEQ